VATAFAELPEQIVPDKLKAETVGGGDTEIVIVVVLTQAPVVPVKVYVVLNKGVTTVVLLTIEPGFQVYDVAPEPVNVAEPPVQTVLELALAVTVELTVTIAVVVPVQEPEIPVIV
jgi:hypothetical protein